MASVYVNLRTPAIPTAVSTEQIGDDEDVIEVDYDHLGKVVGIGFLGAKWLAVNGVKLGLPDED